MKSEWRVMKNPVMDPTPYVAYRLYDVQEVMHSGNIETDYLWFAHKEEALARVAELNDVEGCPAQTNICDRCICNRKGGSAGE